jgi:hypothetical protein
MIILKIERFSFYDLRKIRKKKRTLEKIPFKTVVVSDQIK